MRFNRIIWLLALGICHFTMVVSAKPASAKDFKLDPGHYDVFHGIKDRIYLCDGLWKLKKLKNTEKNPKNDPGTVKGYWKSDFNDKNWPGQVVPWDWNAAFPEDWSVKKDKTGKSKPFGGVGWYRRKFFVPEKFKGDRLIIWFGTVDQDATVFVNGEKVGSHENFCRYAMLTKGYDLESFEFDITDAIKFGKENVIAVRVYDDGVGSLHKEGQYSISDCGGIIQPVFIKVEPAIYAENIRVTPKIKSSEIEVSCVLNNCSGKSVSISPFAKVADFKSARYTPKTSSKTSLEKLGKIDLKPGKNSYSFTMKLNDPIFWDFENPHLYLLKLNAELDGKKVTLGAERFGFSEFRVKKKIFTLNGLPVRLRGTDVALFPPRRCDVWSNQYNLIDDHIKFLTENQNYNFVRCHRWLGRTFHDICDERGLTTNESMPLAYSTILAKRWGRLEGMPKPPEAINSKTLKINPDFKKRVLDPWIQESYNHPCVIMYNVLNEPYDKPGVKMAPILDEFYELIKKMAPDRVVAGYSGRWPKRDEAAKTDVYDVHEYVGSLTSRPYTQLFEALSTHSNDYIKQYKSVKPMINGECIKPHNPVHWYLKKHTGFDFRGMNEIPRKDYVDFFEKAEENYVKHKSIVLLKQILSLQRVPLKDAFDWDYGAHKAKEVGYKRMIEGHRMSDAVEGFNMHCPQLRPIPRKGKKNPDIYSEVKKVIGKACAPLLICCERINGNLFAGGNLDVKVWVVNDTMNKTSKNLEALLGVKDKSGEVVKTQIVKVGSLAVGERKAFSISIPIPEELETGRYNLAMDLRDGKKTLCDNSYDFFVLGEDDNLKEIPSYSQGFLSSIGDLFTGSSKPKIALALEKNPAAVNLKKVLNSFDIEYSVIKDWNNLSNFDILFVAGLGVDNDAPENKSLEKHRSEIQKWIEKGGKLVSIAHKSSNPIPGLPSSKVKISPFGGGDYGEVVLPKHPLFKKIPQACWDSWNGKYATIYKRVVTPLSECVLVRGGGWRLVGMVVAEAKSGKGLVLADETLALEKYDSDSVAKKYFDNLLNYVLSEEWDGRNAEKMRGEARDVVSNEIIKVGKVFQVDLKKQANRGFKDDVNSDKKGGWTDQGTKDLRHFPVGKKKLLGVEFDIVDPKTNSDKSCVVLGGKHRPYFPVKATIPVNKKAKKLFFLISAAWCGSGEIAKINVNYKGGTGFAAQRTIPIVSGKNIADWTADVTSLPEARIAWKGINPVSGDETLVYLLEWDNPEPNIPITHIDFVSTSKAVPVLIAVTGEEF